MARSSASEADSVLSQGQPGHSPDSSPPPANETPDKMEEDAETQHLVEEENRARSANEEAEKKRKKAWETRRKNKPPETKAEREQKARELDDLLKKSAAFSDILTKKTNVLGRVGSSLDGKALGEHNLAMAKQPEALVGGTMRDYQLEGLTWMFEICQQGMSGILADEMGLGKTIQVISLIALLREEEFLGPHLIVAPLSTLRNWINEFQKWCPSIPVVLFHGTAQERKNMMKTQIRKHLKSGRPTESFPIVCTSYEMVLREKSDLSRIDWGFIIIDEGHRMKNFDSKLFRELKAFTSATRMLITGTPLQNNLKELWSLLHFLLPTIFTNWEAFESWFDFSDLQNDQGTEEFIGDRMKQDLIKKIHLILQPLLLRRVKADVAAHLPKKREYVLYAPMTKEQTDLYNAIGDKKVDSRAFLQEKVAKQLTEANGAIEGVQSHSSRSTSRGRKPKADESAEPTVSLPVRSSPRKIKDEGFPAAKSSNNNAFAMMMGNKSANSAGKNARGRLAKANAASQQSSPATSTRSSPAPKRKTPPTSQTPAAKSAKSSRQSTPAPSTRSGRKLRQRKTRYAEAGSEEDDLSDEEFEEKLAQEQERDELQDADPELPPEERERARTLEMAKLEVSRKKLGNPLMQLRLVSNSPHNFYNPWGYDNGLEVDETVVTASGKMLLLDRLLHALIQQDHKVLIFSQFATQLDILHDYCTLRSLAFCRIDGSIGHDSRQEQIDAFNNDPDFKVFLLSTRAGGQGINLTAADTVILFDSDWNPQQDLQAQDRCHRIGQTKPVIVYRLATKGTVEENLLMSADAKRRLEKLVIKKGGFKTMGQKLTHDEELDEDLLKSLLLPDGHVFKQSGGEEILSDEDLSIICDRSEKAYERAAKGEGNAEGFQIIETSASGIMTA